MCEPASTTMLVTSLVMTAMAGAASAYGMYQQGQSEKNIAEYNAKVAENEKQKVLTRSRVLESEERQKAMEMQSQQKAALAAQGVDVHSGTALKLQTDTGRIGEMNVMRIRQNSEDQASSLQEQANLSRFQGQSAASQGTMGAIATGIKTVGSMAGTAYKGGLFDGKGSTLLTGDGGGTVSEKWYTDIDSSKFNLGTSSNAFKFA